MSRVCLGEPGVKLVRTAPQRDDEVARALLAKRHAVLTTELAASQARGRAEGETKGRADGEVKGRAEGEAKGRAEGEAKGRAEGEAKGRAEGEAKGRAQAICAVLAARGMPVSAELRAIIFACTDIDQLDRWIARAGIVDAAGQLFTIE